jgi:hypothetical protein
MFGHRDKSVIQAWADVLKSNSSLIELNLAKNDMRADDAKIFADGIRDNGTLSVFNISDNNIGGYFTNKGTRGEKFQATPAGRSNRQYLDL